MKKATSPSPIVPSVRVAVYARQSVDRSTDSDFGSIDAQREAVLAYVASQKANGWVALPDVYSDAGFSGGTIDRPAFARLLADVKAGRVDVVATYKIDRLSRSLLDFSEIMRLFEKHGVTFVSVTQSFNTTTPMGALTLNILMSFAQFERETIAERTRDKIAAMRQRGIWCGGYPLLGYDNVDGRLVVNEAEAAQVRELFDLYLKLGSISEVVAEADRRGLVNKNHKTRAGKMIRGRPFDKNALNRILRSPLVVGRVPYKDQVYDGAHKAIVDARVWEAAQYQLTTNHQRAGADTRNRHGAILRGILFCAQCGAKMFNHFTSKDGRSFHYYICPTANAGGPRKCERARVPAGQIEKFVIERIKDIARDPRVVAETLLAVRADNAKKRPELVAETQRIAIKVRQLDEERRNLIRAIAVSPDAAAALTGRLCEIDTSAATLTKRSAEIGAEIVTIDNADFSEQDLQKAITAFDPVWDQLLHRERARVLSLLIERITFDGKAGEIEIKFRSGGVKVMAKETTA